jgi:diguanylate cyclase
MYLGIPATETRTSEGMMRKLWTRLKSDFQLSILTLVAVSSFVGVGPYSLYRLLEGNWLVGLADAFLVLGTVVAVVYAWRSGDTLRPGQFLAVAYSVVTAMVTINLGINGVFWFYNLVLFNFFVVPPLQAVTATLAVLAVLCGYELLHPGTLFESRYQLTSFAVTSLLASVFAFVFALRGRYQRMKLGELARLDPLTGTGNRRVLDDELDRAIAAYQRYGESYGLLVLDLDHFKSINDRYGHRAGDEVLVRFAEVIQQMIRHTDRLFRLGGEEFVLLVPRVDSDGLEQIAETLLRAVEQQVASPGGAVTVSIGGAMLRGHPTTDAWLHEADECLYEAKRSGRNRSVIAGIDRPVETGVAAFR